MGSQILSLRTIGTNGLAVPNPLASAVQDVLKNVVGYGNMPIDGKWGDCSQQALKTTLGGKTPTGADISDLMGLKTFESAIGGVVPWEKAAGLYCPGNEAQNTGYKPPYKGYVEPVLVAAKYLGLPDPGVCANQGRVSNMQEGTCECPPGTYEDVNTGICQDMESPVSAQPGKTGSFLSKLKLTTPLSQLKLTTPIPTQIISKMSYVPVQSEGKITLKLQMPPKANLPSIANQPTSVPSMVQKVQFSPSAVQSSLNPSPASSGKALLYLLIAGATAAGGWWWWHKKHTATPNCSFEDNDF